MVKRILYIANYKEGVGGISGQVEMLYRHVSMEKGYTATIFSTKGNVLKRLWLFVQLICISRRYDVLHIHGCSEWGMLPVVYGVIAGKIWNKRVIVTYHGGGAADYLEEHSAFAKRWLDRADQVIVLSGFLEKIFREYEIPCCVIPNIIELPEVIHTHQLNPAAPRFISMRHLRELYNIPCIMRAFKRVQKQIPDASLTILGSGPMENELKQYVKENHLRNISFVGQVPNITINEYLANHDIELSAPHIDNMPVSLLEAMNAGVLVISSNVGGVPYMITDGRTGLLFADDDDTALTEKMLWVVSHPKDVEQIIAAAHDEVQRYSWKRIREQILVLYR